MVLWREDTGWLVFPFDKEINKWNLEEFFFMFTRGKVTVTYPDAKIDQTISTEL